MTAASVHNDRSLSANTTNHTTGKRTAVEQDHAGSSQNADMNVGTGRKKSLRVEDPQTVARRAELVARISAIDEMVSKLQSAPESCEIYKHGITSIEAHRQQKVAAAEYRLGAMKTSIESSYSGTLSQLAKAEKREIAAHSALLYASLTKTRQQAVMNCD